MRIFRHIAAYGAAAAIIVTLGACERGSNDGVAARVGETTITKATLDHWTSVIAGGRQAPDPSSPSNHSRRRQALDFLVHSQWLIGEAADRGLRITEREIALQVAHDEKTSFPGGEAEFHGFLEATGQTAADFELLAKVELATAKLRQTVATGAKAITGATITKYYEQHRPLFAVPEMREVRITNRKSAAAAASARRQVESGTSIFHLLQRELLEKPGAEGHGPLERAIRAARPHVLIGPLKQRVDYFVFDVMRVVPPSHRTLAQAEASIRTQLVDEQQQQALTAFSEAWRAKWIARTDCHGEYVVPSCREYDGPRAPETDLTLG